MRTFRALVASVCVATVLAQAAGLAYLAATGKLDRQKLAQLVAVVHGLDLSPPLSAEQKASQKTPLGVSPTQGSDALAMRNLQLDMRERLIDSHRSSLDVERGRFDVDRKQCLAAREAFQKQVADWEESEKAKGIEEAVLLVSKLRPDQAKGQILLMWKNGETDWVITLVRKLPPERQAKLASEFTTPEEIQTLAEIIRRIRDGEPQLPLADKTRTALEGS